MSENNRIRNLCKTTKVHQIKGNIKEDGSDLRQEVQGATESTKPEGDGANKPEIERIGQPTLEWLQRIVQISVQHGLGSLKPWLYQPAKPNGSEPRNPKQKKAPRREEVRNKDQVADVRGASGRSSWANFRHQYLSTLNGSRKQEVQPGGNWAARSANQTRQGQLQSTEEVERVDQALVDDGIDIESEHQGTSERRVLGQLLLYNSAKTWWL